MQLITSFSLENAFNYVLFLSENSVSYGQSKGTFTLITTSITLSITPLIYLAWLWNRSLETMEMFIGIYGIVTRLHWKSPSLSTSMLTSTFTSSTICPKTPWPRRTERLVFTEFVKRFLTAEPVASLFLRKKSPILVFLLLVLILVRYTEKRHETSTYVTSCIHRICIFTSKTWKRSLSWLSLLIRNDSSKRVCLQNW